MGAVPVIISDGWALPFEELIDWASLAIIVPASATVYSSIAHRLDFSRHRCPSACVRRPRSSLQPLALGGWRRPLFDPARTVACAIKRARTRARCTGRSENALP